MSTPVLLSDHLVGKPGVAVLFGVTDPALSGEQAAARYKDVFHKGMTTVVVGAHNAEAICYVVREDQDLRIAYRICPGGFHEVVVLRNDLWEEVKGKVSIGELAWD